MGKELTKHFFQRLHTHGQQAQPNSPFGKYKSKPK